MVVSCGVTKLQVFFGTNDFLMLQFYSFLEGGNQIFASISKETHKNAANSLFFWGGVEIMHFDLIYFFLKGYLRKNFN